MTLVSVVIPTRNRASLLKEAIESVLAVERHDFELEVIVVDDGSTDETLAVVAQYPVTYLRTPGGLGCPGARNAGIMAARGDFIAFLDDDDVWLPTNIAPQLGKFAENEEYGAVHAQVIMTGPDREPWEEPSRRPMRSGWIFDDLLHYWPQSASVVVRRSVLHKVGIYDGALRDGEDWDLLLRIARRYPIGRVAEPVALFRQREANDETLTFGRMIDTIEVFRRRTREERLWRRLALQPILWGHRGWFAARFLGYAEAHARAGDGRRMLNSLRCAAAASPLHTMRAVPRVAKTLTLFANRRPQPSLESVSPISG